VSSNRNISRDQADTIGFPASAPAQHILTMARVLGYQGATCCSLAQVAPYVSFAFNLPETDVATANSLGITPVLVNGGELVTSAGNALLWTTLQNNPQYIARNCSGKIISPTGNPSISEMGDITKAGWRTLWQEVVAQQKDGFPLLFVDWAGDPGSSLLPCGATHASYVSSSAAMLNGAPLPVIANNVFETSVTGANWHTVDAASNIIGAMADSDCFVDGPGSYGETSDFAITQAMHAYGYAVDSWTQRENDAIYLLAQGKQFWCLAGATGRASSERPLRIYAYASLMLTYSPTRTGYWTYWKPNTTGQVEVYPETGIVPANPVLPAPSNIAALKVGGVYVREYGHCFYRGVDKGACAAVVNPTLATYAFPLQKYHHTVTLSGGGVLEGGFVSFLGSAPPANLPSGTAVIATP
jgi:hypothetical protein